jgi:tetratricopeptide (TPR) repeat protein
MLAAALGRPGVARAASSQELLEEAVRQYRAALDVADRDQRLARFRRAELLFARLAEGGANENSAIHNADLYVNLGNAALGAERLGPAIVAYRRALRLDPDHHRAKQNLAHARTLLPAWVPRPQAGGMLDTFFAWSGRLSTGELQLLAAAAFLLAAALLAASILWRQTTLRHLALIPAAAWVLLLALLLASSGSSNAAVVIVPEVIARAADSAHAPPRLPQPLPGGAEVEVVEQRDQWLRVRLADNRDAWLPQSAVETVGGSR